MKPVFIIVLCMSAFILQCRQKPGNSRYIGKYEVNGSVIQVAIVNEKLSLLVPGAPVQELQAAGPGKFKSSAFSDEIFTFIEKNGKVEEMLSERNGQTTSLKKISDTPDDFNRSDSMLTLRKSTSHFAFLYTAIDSTTIDLIAGKLENSYNKITGDFKVKTLPVVTVRIYPDLSTFHEAINARGAPAELVATAFGKNDFRMVSPNAEGIDSAMLVKGVTHEFTHVVHLNVDYSPNNPRWLWEGVAMYEADWFYDPTQIPGFSDKQFTSLSALPVGMDYMLGFVIVEAIRDLWGFDTVLALIKKQGDVQAVLGMDQNKFDEAVFGQIHKKYVLKGAGH